MGTLAHGDNFELASQDALLTLTVWARPDLSHERGAQLAGEMTQAAIDAVRRDPPTGLLVDLTQAPYVMGPITEGHFRRMVTSAVTRRRPVAIATSEAMLSYQARTFLRELAPQWTCQADSVELARAWLGAFAPPR